MAPAHKRKQAHLGTSLDFAAQLTSYIAAHSSRGAEAAVSAGHPISSSHGEDAPTAPHKRLKLRASDSAYQQSAKYKLKNPTTLTEYDGEDIARSRLKMEQKARDYAALKRGDQVPGISDSLVDFDRKWAEQERARDEGGSTDSDSDEGEGDDGADEVIEFEDEFGRLRRGKRSEKEKMERRLRRGALGADELDRMSARPAAPTRLLHGDVIQTLAFNAEDPEKMEELARNRDRSPTPPPPVHYDASKEVRTKGVGFYKFSRDEETRTEEMRALDASRSETELQRQERNDKKASRKHEIERRRRELESRRAKKLADSFLDGLVGDDG